jgi:predicted RNA-binding Zn ribbon-like protein
MEIGDELTGDLAVDLANTLRAGRGGAVADRLAGPDGPAGWLRATGGPLDAGLPELLASRGHVLALLAATVEGDRLPPAAVEAVNRAAVAAPAVVQLEAGELVIRASASRADAFLAEIAAAAISLVGGPRRDRLRRCAAPGCGRWFVASRPRQTWCSPACGNRARLARFHQRHRAA